MKWSEITVFTSELGTELLGGVFAAEGINELKIDDGRRLNELFLRNAEVNWDFADIDAISPSEEPSISAYVAILPENSGVIEGIKSRIAAFAQENSQLDLGTLRIVMRDIDEEDWANNWKQYYKPLFIGDSFLVCPVWETAPENNTRKVLRIDPGMAFGTGLHETTQMCLKGLEKVVNNGSAVLDLGCGSGILSIGASLLGADRLVSVDVDPVCVDVAAANAALNNVNLSVIIGDVLSDDAFYHSLLPADGSKYDIVVANIVAGVLIKVAPKLRSLLECGGTFISSGIISDRLDEVIETYKNCGLMIDRVDSMNDWRAVTAHFAD